MKKIKDLETALSLFEENAKTHAETRETGDYKRGNKCVDTVRAVYLYLKQEKKVHTLIPFLDHTSIGVQGWAAVFLLPIKEQEAFRTLEIISEYPNIHGLVAETTIKEWRNGNLIKHL